MRTILYVIAIASIPLVVSCGHGPGSYSLLAVGDVFQQSSAQDAKIDILWMMDGSGTMANHQTNLATNFDAFISQFVAKNLDFHMVVAAPDAWVRERDYNAGTCNSNPNPSLNPDTIYQSSADCNLTAATFGQLTQFRDGDIYGPIGGPAVHSGAYLLTSATPQAELMSTFSTNIKTGTRGDGTREASFQSLRAVLRRNEDGSRGYGNETHTQLESFRRNDAFLAVIVVSDEEDQSRKMNNQTYSSVQEYTNAFVQFMDGYTGGSAGNRRYSVSGIVLKDKNDCPYNLNPQATQGDRYVSVAQATNGVIGNICSADFSEQLNSIAERIVSLATRFKLSGEPIPETISVTVNGVAIPQSETNGWTYVAEGGSHYLQFNGSAVPPQGASIAVRFDPVALQF